MTPIEPSSPSERIPLDLLDRYLAGDCSPAEAERVARWLGRDPEHGLLVDALRASADEAAPSPTSWDVERMWEATRTRGLRAAGAPRPRRSRAMRLDALHGRTPVVLRVAAAILIAIAAGLLWETARAPGGRRPAAAPWREYATTRGQRADFDLPDGTHVHLNVDSRLRVPPDYGVRARDVALDGEALFDVRHDAAAPFRVHAGRVTAEDIGTRFVVRAYPTDRDAMVVVAEGAVALAPARPAGDTTPAHPARATVLRRGDLARVSGAGALTTERGVAVGAYLAWADGRLVLQRVPLREALPQLARWYDLDFRLADDSIGRLLVTATFDDAPPGEALQLLALSLGVRYERRGTVVTFHATRGP
ncbi:MAG: FecR domain-containing protein [Gemmatimonadaceae bacterium]|nr:FecR domain-containing protein [Gemmatimonadaceae bacterium]